MSEPVQSAAPEAVPESPEVSDLSNSNPVSDAVAANPEAAQGIAKAVQNGEISEAQARKMIKQLTLKVDGKEIIEELPMEVPAELEEFLKKELQMSKLSQKKAQEAAELKKAKIKQDADMNAFLNHLLNSPKSVLKDLGIDLSAFAEQVLNEELEEMQMDPRERQIRELEAELNKRKEAEKKLEEDRKAAEFKAMQDKFAADYERDLLEAMDSNKLSPSPYNISKLANMMLVALEQGIDVSFNDLVPIIVKERRDEIKSSLSGMTAEDILSILSDKTVNDIILKKTPAPKKQAPPTAESIKETGTKVQDNVSIKKREESADDFFRKLTLGMK